MPAKELKINLLPQQEFETSTFGRILTWTLSSFRIIVIVTEMVVMLAFLSRFWLDARSTDLNEEIKQKRAVIAAQTNFEKEFRLLVKRLNIFAALSNQQPSTSSVISTISSYLPPDVALSSLSLSADSIDLRGVSASERSVDQFISNLEASGVFKDVSLVNTLISPEDKSLLIFTLKLSLGSKGGKT